MKFAGFELFADILSSDYEVVEHCCTIWFDGKKLLLKDVEMSCSQIQQMKPVSIANTILEQFAEVNIPPNDPSISATQGLNE